MTNGDKIRKMTDCDLAKYMMLYLDCVDCPIKKDCDALHTWSRPIECGLNLMKWLGEENV